MIEPKLYERPLNGEEHLEFLLSALSESFPLNLRINISFFIMLNHNSIIVIIYLNQIISST